tara:strand:+ start:3067 stop:3168 length:102 start_codon:yes stop_codon:yes gene_type:complete
MIKKKPKQETDLEESFMEELFDNLEGDTVYAAS